MRRLLLCLSLALLGVLPAQATSTHPLAPVKTPGGGTPLMQPADPNHFVFAVGGDNRAAGRDLPMPPTAPEIFSELRLLRPALILWTGDTIYGDDDTTGEARTEYAVFKAAAASANVPLFNAPGNHEINHRADLEQVYQEEMGHLYGSFDYGTSHFIALDTEQVGRKPGIGPEQLAWLRDDLAANRGARDIFVFMHHPLFPKDKGDGWADPANRDEVHRLFVRYRVKVVFSGHEHLLYQSVHDGVRYVVTGGGGAPSDANPVDGGFQHYLLVRVDNGRVSLQVVEPWRLFVRTGPVLPDGSCTAQVSNYNDSALPVTVVFPTDALATKVVATASVAYNGKTRQVSTAIVPSQRPGTTWVRVTVPHGRTATVTIAPPGR